MKALFNLFIRELTGIIVLVLYIGIGNIAANNVMAFNNSKKDTASHYICGNTELDYNYIYWHHPNSLKVKFYLLERSGTNGNYKKIARLRNNKNQVMFYKDYQPNPMSRYRLIAFDSLGDFIIYNTLTLDRSKSKDKIFNLISTKNAHIFYLSYKSDNDQPLKLEIYNENNKIIYSNTLKISRGNNMIKLNLSVLSEGFYKIKLLQNTKIYQQQFAMVL